MAKDYLNERQTWQINNVDDRCKRSDVVRYFTVTGEAKLLMIV